MPDTSTAVSPLAIASAVCGGLSLVLTPFGFCCGAIPCVALPLGLVGAVLGFVARSQVTSGTAGEASMTPAMIGIVTGLLAVLGSGIYYMLVLFGVGIGVLSGLANQ